MQLARFWEQFGMTISLSTSSEMSEMLDVAPDALAHVDENAPSVRASSMANAAPLVAPHTWAGSAIIFIIGAALILTTLAYGTVHYWAQTVFVAGAALIAVLWVADAWLSGVLRVSRNPLQVPLAGLLIVGIIQLAPLRGGAPLSFDAYSTKLLLPLIAALLVYFAATLAFVDTPQRLRQMVRVIVIFGFGLALLGMIQSFISPTKIYGIRELAQSAPFGPFFNRHHFAGYMELTLALSLGLVFSGAIEAERRPLYLFATAMMGIALLLTNSRGGVISLIALIFFLVVVAGLRPQSGTQDAAAQKNANRAALLRAAGGFGLIIALVVGALALGGEGALSRFFGTVSAADPTTGRAHFWSIALQIFRAHPIIGSGLGSFGLLYTQYDTRNGLLRAEQVHNDYLQVLTDTGLIGAVLGLAFIFWLFRQGLARRATTDVFRRGVTTGALAGCFGVLVHSFFDFTLHTPANALLFLSLAALATLDERVEKASAKVRGGKKRRRKKSAPATATTEPESVA